MLCKNKQKKKQEKNKKQKNKKANEPMYNFSDF